MPWWDQPDDEVDSQYAGTQTVWGQSQPASTNASTNQSQNVPTRWDQAAAQLRPPTQGPAPRPTTNQRPATNTSNQRPSSNVVYGPQTQAQATGWGAVVNYLRPALNLPRPSTNRVTYDVEPQEVQYARPQVNTGAYSVQAGQQMQSPTNRLSAVALAGRGSSVPRDEAYYTSGEAQPATPNERRMGVNQNVRQQNLLRASYGTTQPKDDAYYIETDPKKQAIYTWNDMLNDNLKAFTGASLERVKEDWSDVWQAGKGNYFNPTTEAQAQAKEIDEAGRLNQEIMDRAYQLRQTYYQTRQQRALTVDGQALDFSNPANQVALQPFVEQAQKEVGRSLIVPEAGLISQGLSIAGGVLGNVGQVPVLGNVSNLVGNTLGTIGETFNQVRSAINVPVQVGGEDILSPADRLMSGVNLFANPAAAANTPPILPILGSEGDPEFVTIGEIVSAAVETIGHPGEWWSNPGAWSYARNPVTMLAQSWADNVQETIDVVYSVGPAVGQPISPTDNRTLRAIATATLDLSNNASKQNYIEAVLNKPQRLADLKQQQLAAMQVVHNDMLPQDIRDANAKVAAELQMQITGLENADAQTLAYMYMQPLRDAVLATLLDPTMLYDVARWAGVPLPNFSPKGRRLKQVLDAVDATDNAVATKVAGAFARSGDSGVIKRAFWEGGLARTEYEMTRAQTFLAHSLSQVTDKTDIPIILQRLVDNPAEFFTRGIPVVALKGQTIRSLDDAAGFVEMVSVQAQRSDFDQLANSLKALSGQFANLPSLKSASATIPDVIQDIKNAIEIQSAYRNKVSPFSRAIPVGATQARVYTGANAVGDLTYMTEYVDKEGKVLARYAAPTERLAQMEVEMATKGIKAGKYAQTNHVVNMTHNIRRGFSIPALVLNAAGTITNAVGAHIHAWTTGSDTFTPISVVVDRVKTAFPVAPFEYLQEGSVSRMFDGSGKLLNAGPLQVSHKFIKKLRELRGGQTELPLGSLGSLGFGENANKAKIWYKESSLGMNMQVDGAWRRVLEPALIEAGVPESAVRALRSQLERLSKTWDVQDFLDTTLQYATGQAKHLDIAALGKEYETVLTPAVHTALDKLAQAAKTPAEIVTGGQRVLDAEIARWGNMVGYESKVATSPVTVQGMVADLIQDVQTSIEGLARHGVQTGADGANIQAKIAGLRAQIQRAYSVAAQARNPEALEQFRVYFENLEIGKRSLQEQTDRLFREAKVLGSPEAWVSAFQAKLLYHQEFADDAIRWGEETLQRVLTGETAPPAAVAQVVEDVAELVQPAVTQAVESLPNRIAAVANAQPTGRRIQLADIRPNFTDDEWTEVQAYLRQQQLDGNIVLVVEDGPRGPRPEDVAAAITIAGDQRHGFYRVNDLPIEQLPPVAAQVVEQAPVTPVRVLNPDISQVDPAPFLTRRGTFQQGMEEAQHFFRRASEIYTDVFKRAAEQVGDLRAIDIFLQTQGDITRRTSEIQALIDEARQVYLATRGTDRKAKAWKQAADIFYNLKAQENYDLGVWVNAKRKAAIAYLTNMPEPVTFTHSQYGEVTVVGIKNGQVAIQLPTGQMTTIAEDALAPTVLKAAQERLARIANTAADPIKAVEVQGIPPKFAAQVDKEAATLYDVLVESRQKMYTAHPSVTDSTADTIMLLRSLRDKLETAAQNVFTNTPGKLNPAQTAAFIDGANYVKAKFRKWTEAASLYGNEMASFHMIDTNRRYRADETASLVMPYHVWKTRMGRNLAEMIATQPIIRHAFDIEDALFEQMNGDQAKKSVELDIGGVPVKVWAGLGRYLTSVGDWNGDPTYYEQQRLDGPLGGLYAVEQAVGSGVYPWFGMADNFLRTQTGQEPIENGGARYAQGIFTLAWRLAELSGTNVFKLLDPLGMKGIMQGMTKRDQSEVVRVLQAGVNRGAMTNIEAYYAMGLLDNYVSGKPLPEQMTADQKVAAEKLLNDTIVYLGRKGVTDYFATIGTSLLGLGTVREQVPGAADLSSAQALRADLEYPANEAGGAWAQRAVMTENPGIAVGFARYNIGDPTKESPALIARATEFQTQADVIYAEMSNAVTKYILSQAGTVASYKAVKDLKQPFYAQIDALKEQYADIEGREFSPPDLQKKNPYERALYELEQVLRNSGKDAPAAPLDTMTPEQQVDGWAAIEKFNAAQLDTIERQIEQLSLSYEGPGDPPAQTAWMAELAKLTNNQYASELLRKYDKLKYADRVEKQWDQYGAFEKELDATVYAQQQENVRERLGESAVRDYQVYQRVKDENKAQYKDEHPAVALAMIAAYNPEAWDTAQQLFGQDAWTTYRAYKDKQPKWPGDTASDAEKAAYNQAVATLRKQYPQAVELAFWVDGRYRWWYGSGAEQVMREVPGQVRQGKFGEDYDKALALFGDNIFEIVAAYPIGGTGKQKAQYYDRYPQYAAFQAWRQQYANIEDVKSIADLQTLALAQLPAAKPEVNASIPPWWTQFAAATEGGAPRPLGSGREPINETPAQAQQRLIQEAKFKATQQLEAAKTKAIADKGKAAIIDSSSYQERMDDEYQKRYGRRAGYTRRYYGGRRGGSGGTRRTSYGGGGGGGAGYYPAGGTDPSLNPALWSQPKRNITPLNVGGDINPSLWGSLLERLRRPGR